MKDLLRLSFWQLLIIYGFLSTLMFLGIMTGALSFQLFSLALMVLAFFALDVHEMKELKLSKWWLLVIIVFCAAVRVIPYIGNEVPLGYDPGIHVYVFESFANGQNNELTDGFSPGLLYMAYPFMQLGSDFFVKWLFLSFSVALGLCLYLAVKAWHNESAGIMAFLVYSLSYTQFLGFWYNYYKNIAGLCIMLLALWSFKQRFRYHRIAFVLLAGFTGATHKPTFLILALSFLLYAVADELIHRKKELTGNLILLGLFVLVAALFYLKTLTTLFSELQSVATTSIGSGTFINYGTFALYSTPYLAFALIGLVFLLREKKADVFSAWTVVSFMLVFFKVIFYNRYIIHLDIALIALAGLGLANLKNKWLPVVLALLVASSGFFLIYQAFDAKPLISAEEFNEIKNIHTAVEENATVLSTHKHYTTWLLGYSGRYVGAPGMLDDRWGLESWHTFWNSTNITQINELLRKYDQPVYFYVGERQEFSVEKFRNECYAEVWKDKLFKFLC